MIILYILALLFIFYLLAKICDQYFVKSLDIIAKKLKLSEDVAGATFMAIGTSAPEFFTALIALTKVGSEDVGAGTIVGSAIFNILVIVGASAAVATTYLKWKPVVRDMGFYTIAIIILLITFRDGTISLYETLWYLGAYGVYIYVLSNWSNFTGEKEKKDELDDVSREVEKDSIKLEKQNAWWCRYVVWTDRALDAVFPSLHKSPKAYLWVFTMSILTIIGFSWALIELAILIAHDLGIPEVIIALTILAGGTSIPDLLSSLIVAKQGRGDMAVSNAVGSNTFDILICLGLPWFFYILFTGRDMVVGTENLISSIVLLFSTVISLMFLLLMRKFRLSRRAGFLLLGLYGGYLFYAIGMSYFPEIFQFKNILSSII